MNNKYEDIFEELKKAVVYGIVAIQDEDGGFSKFTKTLLENGCPADAFMEAVFSLDAERKKRQEEE